SRGPLGSSSSSVASACSGLWIWARRRQTQRQLARPRNGPGARGPRGLRDGRTGRRAGRGRRRARRLGFRLRLQPGGQVAGPPGDAPWRDLHRLRKVAGLLQPPDGGPAKAGDGADLGPGQVSVDGGGERLVSVAHGEALVSGRGKALAPQIPRATELALQLWTIFAVYSKRSWPDGAQGRRSGPVRGLPAAASPRPRPWARPPPDEAGRKPPRR